MSNNNKEIEVTSYTIYPCEWDDLFGDDGLFVTIYTLKNVQDEITFYKKHGLPHDMPPLGITLCSDGVYDIVVDVPILTIDVVKKTLKELSQRTGLVYKVNLKEK